MSAFSTAIDEACEERATTLARDLHSDEVEAIEDRTFRSWIDAARFNELIEYAHDEFELQDGEAFCSTLGTALCNRKNSELVEKLFEGLSRSRQAAFWRVWPKAEIGHIGAMKEASGHLANAMKAFSELYRCYAALDNEAGKVRVKGEMLRLQARTKSEA